MATAEVAARPQPERSRRKPFAQWVKNLTSLKHKEKEGGSKKNGAAPTKHKKSQTHNGTFKNNPYPKSGQHLQPPQSPASSANGHLSFATNGQNGSYGSLPTSTMQEREVQSNSNRSGAPTLATNSETVHSDAGHSKAATTTTHGGALSSIDGAGADSTFSSPAQSQHSLSTTLTTIQSTSPGNTLQAASWHPHAHHHGSLNNPNPPMMFSHQYPVSPAPSTGGERISAIPRHVADSMPNTYNSATANNLLSDNASILTLASSSKRRRRSMDTDASVRALAPSSVWGGSRESLPLSVLSGNVDAPGTTPSGYYSSQSRPSIGGIASAERASIYSSQGVGGIASERNSYISHRPGKDLADGKSMRSITLGDGNKDRTDTKSLGGEVGSLRGGDVGSLKGGEVGSLRGGYEGSMKSGKAGHARNDSISENVGNSLISPRVGYVSASDGLSRRSSDWRPEDVDRKMEEEEEEEEQREESLDEEEDTKSGGQKRSGEE